MSKLFYKFFLKFCNFDKYEEMGMGADSLYLALAEKYLYDYIWSAKGQEWESLCSKDCKDSFAADAWSNLFPLKCCAIGKKTLLKWAWIVRGRISMQRNVVFV